jgi:hypothetical protein
MGEIWMAGPTQTAEWYLRLTTSLLRARASSLDNETLAMALTNMSEALIQMSIGLRATYEQVEEIKQIVHPMEHSVRRLLTAK